MFEIARRRRGRYKLCARSETQAQQWVAALGKAAAQEALKQTWKHTVTGHLVEKRRNALGKVTTRSGWPF